MEDTILKDIRNIAVVDNQERERISSIISELIASGMNILVISSAETTHLYRELHDRYSGKYLAQVDDFKDLEGNCCELEIVSGNYLISMLFNKKVNSIDLADYLCSRIQCSLSSFLIVDDIYAVGNEHLKSCVAMISKNSMRNKIYLGLVLILSIAL
ncbi:hypothetical protein [Chamaesiphon sp.]|uniref:hypothetical protein n=1 Tax=Chamaesiphon sp. TaxID=2814140 RepID=UPI0035934576